MGNFFSLFENDVDKIIRAPSGQYTVTPATEKTSTSSPAVPENTNNTQSPSESPKSDEKCVKPNPASTTTTTTVQTRIANTPIPENQVDRNKEDDDNKFLDFVENIFNATTYTIIFWIVTLYGFYLLGKAIYANKGVGNESSGVARYSRKVDLVLLFLLLQNI